MVDSVVMVEPVEIDAIVVGVVEVEAVEAESELHRCQGPPPPRYFLHGFDASRQRRRATTPVLASPSSLAWRTTCTKTET